jgi:hypothetical protein
MVEDGLDDEPGNHLPRQEPDVAYRVRESSEEPQAGFEEGGRASSSRNFLYNPVQNTIGGSSHMATRFPQAPGMAALG